MSSGKESKRGAAKKIKALTAKLQFHLWQLEK